MDILFLIFWDGFAWPSWARDIHDIREQTRISRIWNILEYHMISWIYYDIIEYTGILEYHMISWIFYDILGYHGTHQEPSAGRFLSVAGRDQIFKKELHHVRDRVTTYRIHQRDRLLI